MLLALTTSFQTVYLHEEIKDSQWRENGQKHRGTETDDNYRTYHMQECLQNHVSIAGN